VADLNNRSTNFQRMLVAHMRVARVHHGTNSLPSLSRSFSCLLYGLSFILCESVTLASNTFRDACAMPRPELFKKRMDTSVRKAD